jgi:hypothetical protein
MIVKWFVPGMRVTYESIVVFSPDREIKCLKILSFIFYPFSGRKLTLQNIKYLSKMQKKK